MRIKRVLVALGVMFLVVLVGLYWEDRRSARQTGSPDEPRQQSLETPDFDPSNWNVSPEATVTVERGQLRPDTGSNRSTKTLTIPGRVRFPEGVKKRRTRVNVDVIPVDLAKARKESPHKSIKSLLRDRRSGAMQSRAFSRELTTDENGFFSLKNAPPGIYRANSIDTEWSGKTEASVIQTENAVKPLEFRVHRYARLIGHVVNQDSEPVPGARVPFITSPREARTDDNGRFVLNRLPPNEPLNFLKIQKRGLDSHYLSGPPLKPGEVRHDTYVLRERSSLTVRVRTRSGKPITEGRLMLRRIDDKKIPDESGNGRTHRAGTIKSLDENGQVAFRDIQPGKVRLNLTFANYLGTPKTIDVEPGESPEVILEAVRGRPIRIRYVNSRTDETVEGIRPRITSMTAGKNRLKPSFEFRGFEEDGTMKGVVHPDADRIKIRSKSPQFDETTSTFTRSDLPDITIRLNPLRDREENQSPPGLLKVNLNTAGNFTWPDVTEARVYVLERDSGRHIIGRTGHRSVFEEPFPLHEGSHTLYGTINTENGQYVTFRQLDVSSSQPGQITVTPEEAARITGRIRTGENLNPTNMEVAVSLSASESGRRTPERNVYYPDPLVAQPDENGNVTLDLVPPEIETNLHVLSRGNTGLRITPGRVLVTKSLPVLSPGETRNIGTLSLRQ